MSRLKINNILCVFILPSSDLIILPNNFVDKKSTLLYIDGETNVETGPDVCSVFENTH